MLGSGIIGMVRILLLSSLVRTGTRSFYLPKCFAQASFTSKSNRWWCASSMELSAQTSVSSAVDVERVRKDMLDAHATVQLNSAGDSPMPRTVLDRVTRHLEMEATVGGYEAAARCREELEEVYESAARLINANPDEIALQVRLRGRARRFAQPRHCYVQLSTLTEYSL